MRSPPSLSLLPPIQSLESWCWWMQRLSSPVHGSNMSLKIIKPCIGLPHRAIGTVPHYKSPVGLTEVPVPPPAFMGLDRLHLRTVVTAVLGLIPLVRLAIVGVVREGVRPGETLLHFCSLSDLSCTHNNCLLHCSSKLWPKSPPYIPRRGHFHALSKFLRTVNVQRNL